MCFNYVYYEKLTSFVFGVIMVFVMQDNIVFLFPGQGSQFVGMGAEIWRDFASARYAFEMVSDVLKTDIVKIMHHGSDCVLNAPENAAVAIFANLPPAFLR